ncbi:YbfB/YjiJ family MFS transporter [Gemmatirosa kalamazoonensis]|uniref:YbfB/YjiJ family MFS transporter n=1 Tax=Gemmatirosa kalamazoonensis TaxID=861299 RepID=UPI00130E3AB9|nr:YbfB/YjiJ family MFS transporter [Gemmatirosa kalamazoonensis]
MGLAVAPIIALGFSRFAYALLLPPMREALGWNYTRAGGMNTANASGYIVGALSAAWWARRFGIRQAFVVSLAISALVLLLTGTTDDYTVLVLLRAIGGVSTAVAFVVGSSLASRVKPALLPVYFAGVGIGIVLSGLAVPVALAQDRSWRGGWLLLGVLSLLALPPAWLAAKATPEHAHAGTAALSRREIARLGATFGGYFLFGAGYVSYMTFVIALLRARHLAAWVTVAFWLVLGVASVVSTLAWGPLLARVRGGRGLALVSAVALVGTIPVLVAPGAAAAFASAVIFGGSFMAGPTAVTALSRRSLAPHAWTAGIAGLTTAFAAGQSAGPMLSGLLSDGAGRLSTGLWLSPILLAGAALVTLLQPHHEYLPSNT